MKIDVLVVGAGFAGSVLAERCASAGHSVVLIDKREHLAGNAYDEMDRHGVLVHRYGPHIFHTNAAAVSEYLSRFTDWIPYEHRVLAAVDGNLYPVPINQTTINRLYGLSLDDDGIAQFLDQVREPRHPLVTSEDVVLSNVGRDLCDKFTMPGIWSKTRTTLEMIKWEHSIFARSPLPYRRACSPPMACPPGAPSPGFSSPWSPRAPAPWPSIAGPMPSLTPPIPAPATAPFPPACSRGFVFGFTLVAAAIFVFAAAQLNRLTLYLSPVCSRSCSATAT
jgi:hypothetical protein